MKLIKRLRLWWNAWLYKQSERVIEKLHLRGPYDAAKVRQHQKRQRKLQAQRDRINQW